LSTDVVGVWHHQTRHLQRDVEAIFIAVEARRGALGLVPGLPLVVALEFDIQQFASPEGVALNQSEHHSRSEAVVGLSGEVAFKIQVVGLVEDTIESQVKSVVETCGVAWCEGKVDHAE
jgi:hypothetical protein